MDTCKKDSMLQCDFDSSPYSSMTVHHSLSVGLSKPSLETYTTSVTKQPAIQVKAVKPCSGSNRTRMTCPHCHAEIVTRIRHTPNCMTHLAAGTMCLLALWCFVCLPYCTESCMDVEHGCPNCRKLIGVYRR